MSSQAATPEHLHRGLVLASSPSIPLVLVTESSSKEKVPRSRNWSQKPYRKMEVKGKKDNMLNAMKLEFTGEIIVVEEGIPLGDLNWHHAPKRMRPRRREVQRLLAEFSYDHLTATREGTEFHMYR
ncbi:hypothetical protein AMTR_s00041p00234090 [Amborella trichopoda]|uniref:Uncharacterized protein n=1 Tax=Amborella trichopoda TaxID=13333 RepID=W1PYW0_AMBTC|nr:hypothetical protein AMTR_s00041p00234090 [Amborella trichopoda]